MSEAEGSFKFVSITIPVGNKSKGWLAGPRATCGQTFMSRALLLLSSALMLPPQAAAYTPPEQYRHEQLTAMQAAFSRFGGTEERGTLDRRDLPNFLRFVVTAMNSAALPKDQVIERSTELTSRLMQHLPDSPSLTLDDLLRGTEKIISYPAPTAEEAESERGRLGTKAPQPPCLRARGCSPLLLSLALMLGHSTPAHTHTGSKQLRLLRKRLERNRLTMPLFDTKGWVRDFEKALKIQWEIYANGLAPMHIIVARSDRLYGTEEIL